MNYQPFKKKLEEEKTRLQKDLKVTTPIIAEEHVGYSTHQADQASEVFEQTKNAAVHDQLEWLLAEVEHALTKFSHATYGQCEACGQPIHAGRLDALPTARYCMTDQQKFEKKVVAS
ncbi:MAG: TraR/DksA C4-type zinc finger protein [Chloroflexota bacterium]